MNLKQISGKFQMECYSEGGCRKNPEAIRTMPNLLLLAKLLGNIEPELLGALPEAVNKGSLGQQQTFGH